MIGMVLNSNMCLIARCSIARISINSVATGTGPGERCLIHDTLNDFDEAANLALGTKDKSNVLLRTPVKFWILFIRF